jgi:hypothetical protein
MLKKLFVTAAAAAAVSVPLAGVAWADPPSDPGSPNGNGIGQGGVPQRTGAFVNSFGPDTNGDLPNPTGGPVAPGSIFKTGAKVPDLNAPAGYGAALDQFFATRQTPIVTNFGPTVPGSATKLLTPGCGNGHGPVPNSNNPSVPVSCVP